MNIVIFSSLPWNFLWQRPHHIASKLAQKGHNIVYFETPVYIPALSLQKRIRKKQLVELRQIRENLWVATLYLPDFRGRLSRVKDKFCQRLFKSCLKKLNFHPDASIFYSLHFVPLIKPLTSMKTKITYDCVDDALSFPEFASNKYLKAEIELIKSSSVCFATSKLLCDKITKYNSECVYLPNAMDFDHFNIATKSIPNVELPFLKHPVIGFIGAISDWVDVDLICRLAERHPEYSVLLVGPVNSGKDKLETKSNIVMVGTKPYETLPSYLSNIDVCLIPFKINNITLASNPIKMYEYLAAGKPVVSTALPEVIRNASGIVYIGKDEEDFIKKVEMAVKETEGKDETAAYERVDFARKNSWESRVDVIDQLLNEIIAA